jgi:hypothetical protein
LETICARCLERDPKARYQSAGELAADLERLLEGRPIVARPVSPPARIWRWSQRNPKLVGAAVTGLLLGAATVWPFRGEVFRPSQFNPADRRSGVGFSVPVQNQFNPFTVPDYTSPGDFVPRRPDTRVTGAPPETGFITGAPDRALDAGLRTNKITADVTAAPPETGFNTSVRDRASEAGLRTNKIAADGPASIQGFVKDAKGEPIKGADVRIESRDGKQVLSTAKTDSKGCYISQRLQPGIYRVTLLVSGVVKASIINTQTKPNQPTQLNFDLKPTSQAGNIARSGKHIVWMPGRTGTHLGGNWVEVDDKGNEHSDSNIRTYSVRR